MTLTKFTILILLNIFFLTCKGQKRDLIKVIEGKGIVFNNDSIILYKTSVRETCKILGIKDQSNSDIIILSMWDGFDPETLESTSGSEWVQEIKYKNAILEFASEKSEDSLRLRCISLREDSTQAIYSSKGLEMGELNPNIVKHYPIRHKQDYISENKQAYNLYHYGVSFQLELLDNGNLKLIEISTYGN